MTHIAKEDRPVRDACAKVWMIQTLPSRAIEVLDDPNLAIGDRHAVRAR